MSENRNLIIAVSLSLILFVTWNYFFGMKKDLTKDNNKTKITEVRKKHNKSYAIAMDNSGERVFFENDKIKGSITLKGLKIDDIKMKNFYYALNKKDNVSTLYPIGTDNAFFIENGWISQSTQTPNKNSLWQKIKDDEEEKVFSFTNEDNVTFLNVLSLDDNYMIKMTQKVINNSDKNIVLRDYGRISKSISEYSKSKTNMVLHEGFVSSINNDFTEKKYSKIKGKTKTKILENNERYDYNWAGFTTGKYWISSLIFDVENTDYTTVANLKDRIQFHYVSDQYQILPKEEHESENYFFSGPKKINLLDQYKNELKIQKFDRSLDLGMLYIFTRPMMIFLDYINTFINNFGLTIIIFTIIIKFALIPISLKSYVSTLKMQKISPEIQKIKDKFKDDKVKISQETMKLFKKNKVNPLSDIIPLLIQIPIFFSLYKVLYVSVDMYQAQFFNWITDLSSPDKTSIFNLFGLIDWTPPGMLGSLGILSILLGVSTFVQQYLTTGKRKVQSEHEKIIKFMPYVFVFVSASFPSGLLIYWISSNLFSILQSSFMKIFIAKKYL
ncbi:membrane protein insertase YidC [Anaplasmataceae bacterium AB001_6]|nr:membrane protein insertase YidC [Anaplasmataceae bacterium AB001_6]